MSSDHQRKKSLREYQHHLPTSHFSGLNLPVRTTSPPPLLLNPVTLLALVMPSQAQLPPVHFSPRKPWEGRSGFPPWQPLGWCHRDALPIGNRDPEKNKHQLNQRLKTHTSFAKSQQFTSLKHSMSNSSRIKMQSAHVPLILHPLKIQQQSMNQLKQNITRQCNSGVLGGFTSSPSSPHGIAPAHPACHCRHKSICNACGWTWDFHTSGWWFCWLLAGPNTVNWISLNITFLV